jgi:integrase
LAGSIQKRNGNKYFLTISNGYDGSGKRIRYTRTIEANSPREAEKQLSLFLAEVEKNQFIDSSKLTFAEFINKWLVEYAEKNLAPKTLLSYKSELENRIIPALGAIKINKLKPIHLIQFYNQLSEDGIRKDGKPGGLSGKTQLYYHHIISSILKDAVQWQFIESNAAEKVKPPKVIKKKIGFYDEIQTAKLLSLLDGVDLKWKTIVYVALYTGMRKGEIMGLEWQDIDFEKGVIQIERTSQYVRGIGTITKEPKNETSKRSISAPQTLLQLLKTYKAFQIDQRMKIANLWKNSNRLFTTWDGAPMFPDAISNWFSDFIKANNLPQITFHGLRHTSASILIDQGLNIKAVSSRLGHADTSTTMNIYAHALKSADRQAADIMDTMFNKSEVGISGR